MPAISTIHYELVFRQNHIEQPMTKILLIKDGFSYKPAYPEDQEKLRKVKQGDTIEAKTISQRNIKHQGKYWVLMKFVSDNIPEELDESIRNKEDVHYWVRMLTGHYEEKVFRGKVQKQPLHFQKLN